jgi:GAF domain-containing protein
MPGQEAELLELRRLAAEQSALRRVAELIARQAPAPEVFAVVTEELGDLLGADVVRTVRFERDGTGTVVAALGRDGDRLPPDTTFTLATGGVLERVFNGHGPSRIDDYSVVGGPTGSTLRAEGVSCSAAGPIVVDGQVWGAMVVAARTPEGLPAGSENRVAEFAELASAAISNSESRAEVQRLAAEQSALRRVAELVARQARPDDVFTLVTEELGRLLGVSIVRTVRFEADGTATVVAAHGIADDRLIAGDNFSIPEQSGIEKVLRTGRPARLDDFTEVEGPIAAIMREQGAEAGVAGPIVVDGRLWGAMAVGALSAEAVPPGTEERVAQFAELVSTAISNVES